MHYPDEAGYPFGEDSAPTYFLMEVHYDNPQLLSGRKDNSGYQIRNVCMSTLPINKLIHNVTFQSALPNFCIAETSSEFIHKHKSR